MKVPEGKTQSRLYPICVSLYNGFSKMSKGFRVNSGLDNHLHPPEFDAKRFFLRDVTDKIIKNLKSYVFYCWCDGLVYQITEKRIIY